MPALKNSRQERFAQLLAKGQMSQDQAYRAAGYKTSESNACANAARLSGNERVAARVAEIKDFAAMRVEVSLASLTKGLLDDAEAARKHKTTAGLAVAVQAQKVLAEMHGFKTAERKNDRNALRDIPVAIKIAEADRLARALGQKQIEDAKGRAKA